MQDNAMAAPLPPSSPPLPPARILSNGSYTVLIAGTGGGCSAAGGKALTVWREDSPETDRGFLIYVRDLDSGDFWSSGSAGRHGGRHSEASPWRPGCFQEVRGDEGLEVRTEVCVCSDAPAELRRITVANRSGRPRRIELTSFVQVALMDPAAYAAHPEFSKLFVQTEFAASARAVLARRRPRAAGEMHPWMVHAVVGGEALQYETDRARFLGRGASLRRPQALAGAAPLPGTTGNVLDPVMSLRVVLGLAEEAVSQVCYLLGTAPDRTEALALAGHLSDPRSIESEYGAAAGHEVALLERLEIDAAEANRLQTLAGAMLCGDPGLRAAPAILQRARGRIEDLARFGISGRRHLAVLHADHPQGAALARRVCKAHEYWLALGLPIDVAILIGKSTLDASTPIPRPGGVSPVIDGTAPGSGRGPLVIEATGLTPVERDLIDTVARLVIDKTFPGPFVESVAGESAAGSPVEEDQFPFRPAAAGTSDPRPAAAAGLSPLGPAAAGESAPEPAPHGSAGEDLHFFNGHGGFAADGREYVIRLRRRPDGLHSRPPRPWINVVANDSFGFLVSETGAGYTWSGNSREHRLTPWSNDPLLDPPGEVFYIRDEAAGVFWSPLPGPVPGPADYEMRHGLGYSRCRHESFDLEQETTLFVPRTDPVRITTIRITNRSLARRRLSFFACCRLVLGTGPEESGRFVVTGRDEQSGALLARNHLAGDFADGITFGAVVASPGCEAIHDSGNWAHFLGRDGDISRPEALRRAQPLEGRVGAGFDPCLAQQVVATLEPGALLEVSFLLGEVRGLDEVRRLVDLYSSAGATGRALADVRENWTRCVSGLQVRTPSPALDLMINGWLPYQTLTCRIRARSAFYQSGGAYGYRDQLQDAAALVHIGPDLTRNQILLHAAHQFREGDVLHWWHPPCDRGLRTRFADDLLWLPGVTAGYIQATGDWSILDESVGYLAARPLDPGEDEVYLKPSPAGESADLYDHCVRAIDRSLTRGIHGLPLFGSGDWNDGMNRVGREGKGESVWMGFFLHAILGDFIPVCRRRGDEIRAGSYASHREALKAALNEAGWDGEWYRRGYYDDGTPLGSRQSEECRIDALAQAWAVISGAAPADRADRAMDAVEKHLISGKDGLIRLLTPPFENSPQDPGYIKGYVPGVRENGGQYTHAALWVVKAMAELGRRGRATQLLEMLNPINHALTMEQVAVYQVEPYVIAADVYGAPPHIGRGGWTWYTGSAGWMYRVAIESILGFDSVEGRTLRLKPRIPDDWPGFRIEWRVPGQDTTYGIVVTNPTGRAREVVAASVDGAAVRVTDGAAFIPLARDGREHRVEVVLGAG